MLGCIVNRLAKGQVVRRVLEVSSSVGLGTAVQDVMPSMCAQMMKASSSSSSSVVLRRCMSHHTRMMMMMMRYDAGVPQMTQQLWASTRKNARYYYFKESWMRVEQKMMTYNYYKVALINALNAMQPATNWTKLVSVLMAQLLTRGDPVAWCYSVPVTEREKHLHEEIEDVLCCDGSHGWLRVTKKGIVNAILNVVRLAWLWIIFSPVVLTAPIALGYGVKRDVWMRLLRTSLERSGPAFIKWGQWAATRADLFPRDMCKELEKLHSDAPAHDFSVTETTIEEAFGFPVNVLFDEFNTSPVASGSIGQIHRAKVSAVGSRLTGMEQGSVVAVKVRHPGVTESIQRDFALMTSVARLLSNLPALKNLRLEESLKQFAAPLREQVDLSKEGFYLHAFNYNFRKEATVRFPVPLYPLVSPTVLVETFEPGEHISAYVAKGAGSPHNTDLAQIGARTMLHMLIVDNLVHSDLHPGNILVNLEPVGGTWGMKCWARLSKAMASMGLELNMDSFLRPSIVLLDAGMCTQLSKTDQMNMVGLFEAFSRLDAGDIADWVLSFAGDEQTCPDPEDFRNDLCNHFDEMRSKHLFDEGNTSSGAEALATVLEMVRLHHVSLPGHICATVVTTLVLEGWSHQLDPAHSTLNEVKRIISLKKGETKARKVAMWIQNAAVEREILEHVPPLNAAKRATIW
ncbi:Putative serine/threonine-protein kinase abkC [Picochlorum sp. SENEW3]|nr:Putative serine/threonine-protein kinase abkC [Picochlorum sp. SENEW3]